jgi:hypothetical protein
VADAWLPGAGRLHSKHDGGSPGGGVPRAVWHTSENDPHRISARSVAQQLEKQGGNAHLIWNPCTGEIVQMVPVTRAALLLPDGVRREGRHSVQILVVGYAAVPFTDGPLNGVERIVAWLDIWKVPRHWPAGPPLRSPDAYHAARERRLWARGGHFGASQVPHTRMPGPGAVDIWRITGPVPPAVEVDTDALLGRRVSERTPVPAHAPPRRPVLDPALPAGPAREPVREPAPEPAGEAVQHPACAPNRKPAPAPASIRS